MKNRSRFHIYSDIMMEIVGTPQRCLFAHIQLRAKLSTNMCKRYIAALIKKGMIKIVQKPYHGQKRDWHTVTPKGVEFLVMLTELFEMWDGKNE